jgi:hypothetical protein
MIFNGIQTIAAAGSDQSTATSVALPNATSGAGGGTVVKVTGADGTKGVKMPALSSVTIGALFLICNTDGSNNLEVYPNTSDAITPGSDDGPITVAANTILLCIALDDTQWFGSELPIIAV